MRAVVAGSMSTTIYEWCWREVVTGAPDYPPSTPSIRTMLRGSGSDATAGRKIYRIKHNITLKLSHKIVKHNICEVGRIFRS